MGGKQTADLDNIQVEKEGGWVTCEPILRAQHGLHPASEQTHLNWCMNSINSRTLKKDPLISPFGVKLVHMNMVLSRFKTITHPSA